MSNPLLITAKAVDNLCKNSANEGAILGAKCLKYHLEALLDVKEAGGEGRQITELELKYIADKVLTKMELKRKNDL